MFFIDFPILFQMHLEIHFSSSNERAPTILTNFQQNTSPPSLQSATKHNQHPNIFPALLPESQSLDHTKDPK